MQKNTVLTLGLLSLATLGLPTAQANVKLVLDNSKPLGMVGETNYDLTNNIIEITMDRPVLCNQAPGYNSASLTKLRIYDPNLDMKGGFASNEGIYFDSDADYLVNNGQLFLNTDNPLKALCVSAEVGNYDLIFKTPFEDMPPSAAQIEYVGLPNIVAPGQVLNYEIQFYNPSGQTIYFDLLEYWNEHFDLAATLTAGDNIRVCNNNNPDVQCQVNDPSSGVMKGIQLASGGTFVLDVTQKVSDNSTVGAELDFMTAAFLTNGLNGDFLPRSFSENPTPNDPHIATKTVTVQTNTLPQLSWQVAPGSLTTFHEDESTPQVFEIRYSDVETNAQDLVVTVTDQLGNIVNVSKGPFVADGLDGTKTLTLLPLADAYTDGTPEQITVTVTDAAAGEATLTFDVEVLPVNDAPSFAMNCSELTVNEQNEGMTCTVPIPQDPNGQLQGVWDGHYIIADFNPGPNESQQSALEYEVQVIDNTDGILDDLGSGDPVIINPATGEISVVTINGTYGTAEVQIQVRDNGGTTGSNNGCGALPLNPEDGCDVSDWLTLNIVSQPYQYSVSGEITGVPSGKIFTLRLNGTENNLPVLVDTTITTNTDENTPNPFTLLDTISQTQFLDDGTPYTVTIEADPPSHTCVLNNGAGTINGANITNVQVACTENAN
ncbi:MAG: hypothetical protein DWP95_01920 [Proteobacteria bacterium]|nr:MAG: hypothetical protein DWP95_01920 [Pseudomonadota bacterium]